MTVASQIGYRIIDRNYKNKEVTQDQKLVKPLRDVSAGQLVIKDNNKHTGKELPSNCNDPKANFEEEEEASSDESDEEQYTDVEDEDEEPTSYEEEYMDEVDTLIRMEERLEK